MNSIFNQLKKEIEYALNSKSLTLAYQAYGAVKWLVSSRLSQKSSFSSLTIWLS